MKFILFVIMMLFSVPCFCQDEDFQEEFIDFEPKEIVTADIDETPYPDENPVDYVRRMAQTKAEAVHVLRPQDVILAADTIVVCGNKIIQKWK